MKKTKYCECCKKEKSLSEFYKTADGRPRKYCKPCTRAKINGKNEKKREERVRGGAPIKLEEPQKIILPENFKGKIITGIRKNGLINKDCLIYK